jgi:hypothetical protein
MLALMLDNPSWLFLSLIPSAVGFVLFVYGKKQQRRAHFGAGLALMTYPYFATTIASLAIGAGVIGAAFYAALQAGW